MEPKRTSSRFPWRPLLLTTMVIMPLSLVSSSLLPWSRSHPMLQGVHDAIYPLQYVVAQAGRRLSETWEQYIDLTQVAVDNAELNKQLTFLQMRMLDYEEQLNENKRLRKLLGFSRRFDRLSLLSEVISPSRQAMFSVLRIAHGRAHRVEVGMPVVAANGVVGRVLRVGSFHADVQLLVDANFHLDVLMQRTRVRGILKGFADGQCVLNLHQNSDVRIGDTLVTSGLVSGFPKGVPVGRVQRISYKTDNVTQVVTVQPWVDYRSLEEVMVLSNEDDDLIKIQQVAGNGWIESMGDSSQAARGSR